ncbi:LysR substrate-binding domain-containing protein [Cereibacter sp. SYSU M97828]|nr:LysR substrate-binding domain-containing protein [Cereibacter flavus]
MRKRTPLNAIRAFEAVARNASVARAADELCVTPTAVSHQIRLLEEFLQAELFQRKNGRMFLTPESSANLSAISRALDLIDDAVMAMNRSPEERERSFTVAASASVASFWLIPRIASFLAEDPDLDLNLSTFLSRKEAETRECDIRICNWRCHLDCLVEPLVEEEILPVCAPSLAQRYDNDHAEILRRGLLVHVDRTQMGYEGGDHPDWAKYLGEYGILRPDVIHGPRLNQSGTAIEAARAGVGVILGRSLLIEEALRQGDLIAVGESFPARSSYFMLTARQSGSRARFQKFKDWMIESVRPNPLVHAL